MKNTNTKMKRLLIHSMLFVCVSILSNYKQTLASTSPCNSNRANIPLNLSPNSKAHQQPQKLQKFLDSKLGKWLMAKADKKQKRMKAKLVKAEAKGNYKKIERIKKTQSKLGTFGGYLFLIGAVIGILGGALEMEILMIIGSFIFLLGLSLAIIAWIGLKISGKGKKKSNQEQPSTSN
jgi:hypothetical protein